MRQFGATREKKWDLVMTRQIKTTARIIIVQTGKKKKIIRVCVPQFICLLPGEIVYQSEEEKKQTTHLCTSFVF